jgi:hypothetical protein
LLILLYFGVAVVFYFSYSVHHSVGNLNGWADLLSKSGDPEKPLHHTGNPVHEGTVHAPSSASPLHETLLAK